MSPARRRAQSPGKSPQKRGPAGEIAHEDIEFEMVDNHDDHPHDNSENNNSESHLKRLSPLKNKQPAVAHETPQEDSQYEQEDEEEQSGYEETD